MIKQLRKKKTFIILAAVVLLAGAAGILAMPTGVVNELDTGYVDVTIDEYILDPDGNEVPFGGELKVSPGNIVPKTPYFTVLGEECYIRAQVMSDADNVIKITNDCLVGISEDWTNIGEYYYYKYPIPNGERVPFYSGIMIPDYVGDEAHHDIKIATKVDAVQAANFYPDFASQSPWGDVDIQESNQNGGYNVSVVTSDNEIKHNIVVEDTDNIISDSDDFFSNLKTMMPGDELSDTLKIESRNDADIYFAAKPLTDVDLLNKLTLILKLSKAGEETEIYCGTLNDSIDEVLLGNFEKGEKAELKFTICMPAELDNQYTIRNASVEWSFHAAEPGTPALIDEPPVIPDDPEEPSEEIKDEPQDEPEDSTEESGEPAEETKKEDTGLIGIIKTGDDMNLILIIGVMLISLATVAILIRRGNTR